MNPQGAILGAVNGGLGGAAGGLAYSNPYSAAAMAAGQALSGLLGGPNAPQSSTNQPFDPFTVDNSGWSVNFGDHGSASATANPVSTLAQGLANGSVAGRAVGALGDPLVLLGVLALVIVVIRK